jgi:hypothetical protein
LQKPPIDADDESQKLYDKTAKELKKNYFGECFGVSADIRLLDRACDILAENVMKLEGLRPLDGTMNNTIRDKIVDEALEHAWDLMPVESRPPAPVPVQTKIDKAIDEAIAEKNEDGVELPVIVLPPANGETGEEIAPTVRYIALCAEAEKFGIDKAAVDKMLSDMIGDVEIDHAVIEELHLHLQEHIRTAQASVTVEEILAALHAGIEGLANVEQVIADRQYDEPTALYFKIQEFASAHSISQEALTEWLKSEGIVTEDGGAASYADFVRLAERVIAWANQDAEKVVEDIVNDDAPQEEAEQQEVAREPAKKSTRKARTPARRPGIKPAKKKSASRKR